MDKHCPVYQRWTHAQSEWYAIPSLHSSECCLCFCGFPNNDPELGSRGCRNCSLPPPLPILLWTQSYQRFCLLRTGEGQNTAFHASPTSKNSAFLSPAFQFRSTSSPPPPFPPPAPEISSSMECHVSWTVNDVFTHDWMHWISSCFDLRGCLGVKYQLSLYLSNNVFVVTEVFNLLLAS